MIEIYPIYNNNLLQYFIDFSRYIFNTIRYKTFDKYKYIKVYRIGSVLAYSLNKQNTTLKGREKIFRLLNKIPYESKILFAFGEIDCRTHIKKQSQKQRIEVSKIIDDTIKAYGEFLDEIQNLGYHVHVWNVIPNAGDFESEEFPAIGIMDERFNIVVEFNEKLRKYCENTNKVFLSIMDNLVANNYYKVNPEYYMDNIHLSEKAIALLNVNNAKGFDFTLK